MGIDSVFRAKPLSISCFEEGGQNYPYLWFGDRLAILLGERAELRYGSDSGDTEWKFLEPWEEARKTRQDHWLKVANEPYLSSFR